MIDVGVVAIGRNEGDRLRRCLESVLAHCATTVYVDSGSTDDSRALARSLGAEVVELDLSAPFTAARARNAGFDRLLQLNPDVSFVQFVDGDCEIVAGWLSRAKNDLESRPDVAVVCGRRRERYPEQSVYNRLADLEWDTPIGESKACGGDAMFRAEPLRRVGGYDPRLIAGEEPELCVRLRREGWKVLRIDAEMTLHDLAMTRFSQWWRRSVRTGHAYAEGAARHGRSPDRHFVRQLLSAVAWGMLLPAVVVALVWPTRGIGAMLFAAYPALFARIRYRVRSIGISAKDADIFALFCVLGKFPQAVGVTKYWLGRISGRGSAIIEYKSASTRLEAAQ
jgi:GT2 family glycosyltransferase